MTGSNLRWQQVLRFAVTGCFHWVPSSVHRDGSEHIREAGTEALENGGAEKVGGPTVDSDQWMMGEDEGGTWNLKPETWNLRPET